MVNHWKDRFARHAPAAGAHGGRERPAFSGLFAGPPGADLTYTEFISSESLVRGAISCRRKLDILESERPVGIQLYGGDEESSGPCCGRHRRGDGSLDLLDINFGLPGERWRRWAWRRGAAVLRDPDRMVRLTQACVRDDDAAGYGEDQAGLGRTTPRNICRSGVVSGYRMPVSAR